MALVLASAWVASAATITINPIMVGTGTDRLATDLEYANAIFDQVPLTVLALPEMSISSYEGTTLVGANIVYIDEDNNNLASFLSDTSWQDSPVITVWYVDTITVGTGTARGVTFSYGTSIGIAISLSSAVNDTLAHELAHLLTSYVYGGNVVFTCADTLNGCSDGGHDEDSDNVLASGSIRNVPSSISQITGQGGTYDELTSSQIGAILLNVDYVTPEPAGIVLFSSGGALIWLVRRRRNR